MFPLTHPAVHPRAGGGTLEGGRTGRPTNRFIPARAGNTARSTSSQSRRSVHPRAGGEHAKSRRARAASIGSSPRGRGTRRWRPGPACRGRFIPARAGNTSIGRTRSTPITVHPRAGGEPGSVESWSCGGAVHPRAGGEHLWSLTAPASEHGSSPRGREHARDDGRHVDVAGSSPRGRGTLHDVDHRRVAHRFIPARAGNTISSSGRSTAPSVHPRAGGEHRCPECDTGIEFGSSPRGRGTP